ncbi:exonuclease SbcC [Longibacter salinarum]|uniref:Exonuclease SbcC n=1 Tax=Longibacter salinarum TaxID=1850348 RepID=A0A2A8D2Q0_9BACT|nr:SMC family ATPase [Longibacter salinarum]PEN15151.1 exonuclease SbcC [Longibacter salinarum]
MVPVRLELQNFLSYGTDAPVLDFDTFDVACLSGRNGQGKSALLDAITWSVWGEARKSSGKRKPDDELIRIGSRHMEVTFTFDVEGARYRVKRSFSRSATGKTTTSDLEFQLYEPDKEAYQPLTGAHQRETQAIIEDTVGLDYDTFINSAFLLQGRSDEFTKKSPSQRKEILVNILNLTRYEELAQGAREKMKVARDEAERQATEIDRLNEALEDVPEWKEERSTVQSEIKEKTDALESLREEEKALTERLASLRAKAQEAESVTATVKDLDERLASHREEVEELQKKIQGADDLLARSEKIQQEYERYEELQEERERLDEKRDLHRGIEKQIESKTSELERRRNELEKKLNRLQVERKNNQKNLKEIRPKLSRKSDLKEKLEAARNAKAKAKEMAERRDQRESMKESLSQIETRLVGMRQQLQGELDALKERIRREKKQLARTDALSEQVEAVKVKLERKETLDSKLEQVKERGTKIRETLQEYSGEVEARKEEREEAEATLERLRTSDGGACPTCGTDLTASHAEQVEETLQAKLRTTNERIKELEQNIESSKTKRERLLTKYREIESELKPLDGSAEKLATLLEQKRARDENVRSLQSDRQSAAELHRKLQEKAYGHELREKKKAIRKQMSEIAFDAEAFETLTNRAAQVDRYKEQLREIDNLEGRRDELERKIEDQERQIENLRESLDTGKAFAPLPKQIEQLEQQLSNVDFDPQRFGEVKNTLADLKEAAGRMKDLVNAQRNRDDWKTQRERVREKIEAEKEKRKELQSSLATLNEEIQGKAAVQNKQERKAEEVQSAETSLNELQKRLGMLDERLDQAREDRKAITAARKARKEAKRQQQLYKHLRRAFGKHGIPSLIIEETLPEIEERANVLLDRLTDGKMNVRLETLKDKKTGGTKETLEIIITDEQGVPRPYETFSGGESFRVNFALRLALAQLLAERSGVRVRTLVIDEGFGTQDREGIERLVEAIQAVREDFSKILVITHLQELKQAFPVRIEVEKDPVTGSSFDVIGV